MEQKKTRLTISGNAKKSLSNIEIAKTQGKIYHLENPIIVFFRNFFLKHTPVIKLRTQKIWAYKIDNEIEKLIN